MFAVSVVSTLTDRVIHFLPSGHLLFCIFFFLAAPLRIMEKKNHYLLVMKVKELKVNTAENASHKH